MSGSSVPIEKKKPVLLVDTKIGSLNSDQLRKELTSNEIVIPKNAQRPALQVLYALWELKLLSPRDNPDDTFLVTASKWFSSTIKKMSKEIENRNLVVIEKKPLYTRGNRWYYVETLLRQEYDEEYGDSEGNEEHGHDKDDEDDVRLTRAKKRGKLQKRAMSENDDGDQEELRKAKKSRKGKEPVVLVDEGNDLPGNDPDVGDLEEVPTSKKSPKGKEIASRQAASSSDELQPGDPGPQDHGELPKNLSPDLLKLFLTMIHGHMGRTREVHSLKGIPVKTPEDLLKQLSSLPELDTARDITRALKGKSATMESAQLLSAIYKTYDDIIISAPPELKITNMPKEVLQFVVAQPTDKLRIAFNHAAEKSKSHVYFHGTSISNLHSILFDGFRPPDESVLWLAQDPAYSWLGYAYKPTTIPPEFQWADVPFSNNGVLLGCEVVDRDREIEPGFYTTNKYHTVLVRYVFLLPLPTTFYGVPTGHPKPPTPTEVKDAMIAGFKRIRALKAE